MQTAMKSALEKAGYKKYQMAAYQPAADFIQAGGTLGEWISVYKQAEKKLSGDGHSLGADGQRLIAVPRQPLEGDEAHIAGVNATSTLASSPASNRGGGHSLIVNSRSHAAPVREPTASQRKAMLATAKVIAVTVLDTYKVRDGRAIGDVRFGELDRMRNASAMEASVIRQIQKLGVAGHDAKVRDVVKADQLQRIIQRAAEVADAA